jgi:hypothetical protein
MTCEIESNASIRRLNVPGFVRKDSLVTKGVTSGRFPAQTSSQGGGYAD